MSDANELDLSGFQTPPPDAGLSLEQLNQAFAQMLSSGDDPYNSAANADDETAPAAPVDYLDDEPSDSQDDDPCEITPGSILEAMLFVGTPDNRPLESEQIASLMRGVRAAEIDEQVRELNARYASCGCPYRIVSEGAGYRMTLCEEFDRVRDKFLGKQRWARLSTAAVEVLALVAYNGPLTSEEVSKLRTAPSGPILTQLVRRELLSVERPMEKPRTPRYRVTPRFLSLFGLRSTEDLPRGIDIER